MRNKVKLKKFLFLVSIAIILVILFSTIINIVEYRVLTKNFNRKISGVISFVTKKYSDVETDEIMGIINLNDSSSDVLKNYNIDISKDTVVLENDKVFVKFIVFNSIFLFLVLFLFVMLFLKYNKKREAEIDEITKLIEEINKKNYRLNIDDISEDELSILKNEIYKTTVMLKETAEISKKEKLELKESLSDISHQLKTPLTSILIILDNLLEDKDMDVSTRQDFLFDIKREINNINFLVQSLLKLSKLDTNTVKFLNEKVSLKDIVAKAVKKLSTLCDLKNVTINISLEKDVFIYTDLNWQVEAISNILKNSVEHSRKNSSVDVSIKDKSMYSEIVITDYGDGIEKDDLSHIFDRFYKSKNAPSDSIGIGLALAKTIVEKSNGKIMVNSTVNKGTTFTVRYYNG